MKSPMIHHYLETLSNPAGRFRSLKGIEIVRDDHGAPCYSVRTKTLDVLVHYRGLRQILCCPIRHTEPFDLREYVRARYAGTPSTPDILLKEMLVFNDGDESDWFDVLLTLLPPGRFIREKDSGSFMPAGDTAETAPVFREGLAVVEKESRYGYIDRRGKVAIPFRYDWADTFDEGLAVVKQGECFGLIDKEGLEIFAPEHEDIRWRSANGTVLLCDEGKWSICNRRGEPVADHTFDFIFDFFEGLASVRRGLKYGYIDRNGEIVIPVVYDEAYSFSAEGLATVVKNGITFCIDTEGNVFD